MKIKYRANPRKVLEALVWIAGRRPGNGFHFILKTLFYADKYHLQRYGRPVTGDAYVKMPYGPVASLAYDMLKRNEFLPEEIIGQIDQALTTERSGSTPKVSAKRPADESCFSGTDLGCLEAALSACDGKGFDCLSHLTHTEQAWIEAEMNNEMDYELFIDADTPNRDELLEYIRETSECLAL